ncbi:DUF6270 domain-containing protein [Cytobacillus sp. FSL R7-0696]|uniref:DUF6270 domain-containing protein n=1 Tax=Cytobacillus TaxID=2675230 RepID=UPI0030F4EFC4
MNTILINSYRFTETNSDIYLELLGFNFNKSESLNLYFVKKTGIKYAPIEKLNVSYEIDYNKNTLIISLKEAIINPQKNIRWKICCEINGEEIDISLSSLNNAKYHYKMFELEINNESNKLFFAVINNKNNFYVDSLLYKNGLLSGEVALEKEFSYNQNSSFHFELRNRENNRVLCIHGQQIEKRNGILAFSLPINIPDSDLGYKIFDIIIVITEMQYTDKYQMKINNLNEINFEYYPLVNNNFYLIKPYKTKSNTLSLYLKEDSVKTSVKEVYYNSISGKLELKGNIVSLQTIKECSIIIKQRNIFGKEISYGSAQKFKTALNDENEFFLDLDLKNDFPITLAIMNNNWDIFIELKNSINHSAIYMIDNYELNEQGTFNYFELDEFKKIKPYVNKSKKLSLYVSKKVTPSIKVAILGTCFSRNPFNSMNYFNPDYKENYKVVFTQFHSSLISLMSKQIKIDLSVIENLKESMKPFIRRDFDKTFFTDLRESGADIFILDLDIDATHNCLRVGEDKYLTLSYILAQTDFLNQMKGNVELITHDNEENFFELWKKAADLFIEELLTIFPPNRIFLTSGRYAQEYLDSNRVIREFQDKVYIKERNLFWDRLDNYFISRIPGVNVIDLTKTNFIGDELYPLGNKAEPPHYESGYYKEFMKYLNEKLIKVIN